MIRLRAVVKIYPNGTRAVDGVDLEVRQGEAFGLVGPDGAGKTTLLKLLAGVIRPDGGRGTVLERDLAGGLEAVREEIGYIPQRFSLYGDLTVAENVQFFSSIYRDVTDGDLLLERVGLAPFRNRLAAALSGGMKQKLALACCLVHRPQVLLMDEPTVGIDPVSRREFWSLLFELQREGLTVVAATPYMDEAEQFERVALLDRGRILQMGTAEQIKACLPGAVVEVVCESPMEARKELLRTAGVQDVELFGDRLHVFVDAADAASVATLRRRLEQAGLSAEEVRPSLFSIEDVFLRLAGS